MSRCRPLIFPRQIPRSRATALAGPYGTQCHACGPRELNNLREVEDEIAKPTGPLFTDCDAAADAECCRQLHYFPVEASTYFSDSVTGCADVCLALGRLGEDGSCMPNDPECAHKIEQRRVGCMSK